MSAPLDRQQETLAIIAACKSSMEIFWKEITALLCRWQEQQNIILREFLALEEEDEDEDCGSTDGDVGAEDGAEGSEGEDEEEEGGAEDGGLGTEDELGTEDSGEGVNKESGAEEGKLGVMEECRPGSGPHTQTHLALKDLRKESGTEHVKRWLVDIPPPPLKPRKPEPASPTPAARVLNVHGGKKTNTRPETITARTRKRRFSEQLSPGVRKRTRAVQ